MLDRLSAIMDQGLDEVLAPAIRAAEDGFVVTPRSALDWAVYGGRIERHRSGVPVYLPGGTAPGIGGKLSHQALGSTLRRIAREGRSAFYEGAVAEEIVATLQAMGGLMALEDLGNATADDVTPIGADYRGHHLLECPPNGQGVAALLIARILAGFDMADSTLSEADRIHLLAEATKAAYRQRDALVADPAFRPLDVETLLSDAIKIALRGKISMERASAGRFRHAAASRHCLCRGGRPRRQHGVLINCCSCLRQRHLRARAACCCRTAAAVSA